MIINTLVINAPQYLDYTLKILIKNADRDAPAIFISNFSAVILNKFWFIPNHRVPLRVLHILIKRSSSLNIFTPIKALGSRNGSLDFFNFRENFYLKKSTLSCGVHLKYFESTHTRFHCSIFRVCFLRFKIMVKAGTWLPSYGNFYVITGKYKVK